MRISKVWKRKSTQSEIDITTCSTVCLRLLSAYTYLQYTELIEKSGDC